MEYNMPKRINSEEDLNEFENYLCSYSCDETEKHSEPMHHHSMKTEHRNNSLMHQKSNKEHTHTSTAYLCMHLKKHIGKLAKIESLIDNRLESRIGVLLEVGEDYIVIKLSKCCCSMMIPLCTVKYITIAHDNNLAKMQTR